jgi:hypothetical protein
LSEPHSFALARLRTVIEPYVNARDFPVVWLVENVQITIAIEVGQARFVEAMAFNQRRLRKIPFAVAVKNHQQVAAISTDYLLRMVNGGLKRLSSFSISNAARCGRATSRRRRSPA